MRRSFIDAVREESARGCVGREPLQRRLSELYAREGARIVVLVGPGGIGKTTLGRWLSTHVLDRGGAVAWVSGEQIAANPESFLSGVRFSSESADRISLDGLGRGDARDLLLVDSFERLLPLCCWLFGDLLADLGPNLLLVLASRERIPAPDTARLGGPGSFVVVDVDALPEGDAHTLLANCGVAADQLADIYSFTGGHPLALRLAADRSVAGATHLDARDRARIIDTLIESFIANVPSRAHVRALQAASVVPYTDPSLLAAMLGENTEELFAWLSRSAFIERTEIGVSPHALFRGVLFTDVQTRDPDLLVAIQSRLIDALVPRMLSSDLTTAHELYLQVVYSQRNRPQAGHFGALELAKRCTVVPLRGGPLGEVRDLVLQFEGQAGLSSFDAWSQQESFSAAVLDERGKVVSFQVVIRVPRDAVSEQLTDPLVRDSWQIWRERDPAPDEGDLYLFRWFVESETYQALTSAMAHLFSLGPLLTMPRIPEVVHIAFACSPPEQWGPLAPSFQLTCAPARETDFAGRRYCHSHGSIKEMAGTHWGRPDVAAQSLRAHLYRHFGLPLGAASMPSPESAPLSLESLSRALPGFLAELQFPTAQRKSPITEALLKRGVARDRAGLIAWTESGIEPLARAARTARYAEVLRATYLSSSQKQLAAAVDLGLPFGTYRYQLRKAQELLARELWDRLGPLN